MAVESLRLVLGDQLTPTLSSLRGADRARDVVVMAEVARAVRPDILVLCHGGPLATPDDAAFVLRHTRHCHGFYGASSMERLPTEVALTETTKRFLQITR